MNIDVTTAPTIEPLTTTTVKAALRIQHSLDDDRITNLITAVRTDAEERGHIAINTQTITLDLNSDEASSPVWLPRPPFQSLSSFVVYDEDGVSSSVSSAYYYINGNDPAHIVSQDDGWTLSRANKAATVVYIAGYGGSVASVPMGIRESLTQMVGELYEEGEVKDKTWSDFLKTWGHDVY